MLENSITKFPSNCSSSNLYSFFKFTSFGINSIELGASIADGVIAMAHGGSSTIWGILSNVIFSAGGFAVNLVSFDEDEDTENHKKQRIEWLKLLCNLGIVGGSLYELIIDIEKRPSFVIPLTLPLLELSVSTLGSLINMLNLCSLECAKNKEQQQSEDTSPDENTKLINKN